MSETVIALELRLRKCRRVVTLGVRPNFSDYSPQERELIRAARKIYYPSAFYVDLFGAMGKPTFPSRHTYSFAQDKIRQTALFTLLDIPHPRTHVFYGRRRKAILEHFDLPLIAKVGRGSARGQGVFLVRDREGLAQYCRSNPVAYIQEYLPIRRDMRVVVIGGRVVHAYFRVAPAGEFRSNVAVGGRIDLASPVPPAALDLALSTARACGWDDVGLDICEHQGRLYVLEANMKYGREGFREAGIDYYSLMERLIDDGEI